DPPGRAAGAAAVPPVPVRAGRAAAPHPCRARARRRPAIGGGGAVGGHRQHRGRAAVRGARGDHRRAGAAQGADRMNRRTWYLVMNGLVGLWAVATVVVVSVHRLFPAGGWLMVHLLLLGAVSTAILVWSQ